MVLGDTHAHLQDRQALRAYRKLFGIEDYHSHLRWKAIKGYLDYDAARTLEVGAGSGLMTFEIAKRNTDGEIFLSEYDESWLSRARVIANRGGFDNVRLSQEDVRSLGRIGDQFDQVLAIDVLEHIDDDAAAADGISSLLAPGGRLVISVPTPNYPDVMGRRYHDAIGHVRDGYWLTDIEQLLGQAGMKVVSHRYYTGSVSARVCSILYKGDVSLKAHLALSLACRPLAPVTEPFANAQNAASLAVLAVRR